MNKINKRIESIFAHAAALQQSGRLKNTIYCLGERIFILNQDNTILLNFRLRDTEVMFKSPIAFYANDYDSNLFSEKDGYIHFIKENKEFNRDKQCKSPNFTPEQVREIWKNNSTIFKPVNRVDLGNSLLEFIDSDLSHIEFSCVKGELKIVQRNIYSGTITTIKPTQNKEAFLTDNSNLKDFIPVGIRTNDFLALFSFTDVISFYFVKDNIIWFENKDRKMPFRGILSLCSYDELGKIE